MIAKYQYTVGTHEFGKIDFIPDGKYFLVSTGWRDKMWAWGVLPFPRPKMGEYVGIPTIPMPEPLKPAPTATLPLPAVPPPASGGLIADALDKLAEELPKSGRPVAQQIDALFLAALGRLPTAAELKKVDEKYRGRYTPMCSRSSRTSPGRPSSSARQDAPESPREARPGTKGTENWPGFPAIHRTRNESAATDDQARRTDAEDATKDDP